MQNLNRLASLPRINTGISSNVPNRAAQISSKESSPQVFGGPSTINLISLGNKPVIERKASVYSETARILNDTRGRGLPFKVIITQ